MNAYKPLHWTGWLLRVLTCDGLVPVAVFASSYALAHIIRGQGDGYVIVSVGIPLSAFIVRYLMGQHSIQGNYCSALTRGFQKVILVIGLIVVALMDCLLICLAMLQPANLQKGGGNKLFILACGFAIAYAAYLGCMTFAMYPGRELISLRGKSTILPDDE